MVYTKSMWRNDYTKTSFGFGLLGLLLTLAIMGVGFYMSVSAFRSRALTGVENGNPLQEGTVVSPTIIQESRTIIDDAKDVKNIIERHDKDLLNY